LYLILSHGRIGVRLGSVIALDLDLGSVGFASRVRPFGGSLLRRHADTPKRRRGELGYNAKQTPEILLGGGLGFRSSKVDASLAKIEESRPETC
jgi:hypothetical protein